MSAALDNLHEAVSAVDAVWADADGPDAFERTDLLSLNATLATARHALEALQAEVAAGIAHESRSELGADSLAKQNGYRNAAALIATTTSAFTREASQLVKVGQAAAPRTNLVGERLPAKYPAVAYALDAGNLSAAALAMIVEFLDRIRIGHGDALVAELEQVLVERAVGLSLDEVRRMIKHAEAVVEEDKLEEREQQRRERRTLSMFERDGNLHVNLITPVEEGAAIRAAIDGYVSAQFQARRDAEQSSSPDDPDALDADRRTVAMMRADAIALFCEHVLGCESSNVPVSGATVIVRVDADDLQTGTGHGTIDGIDQPISIAAIRRMAAAGGVIPCVLDGEGEILDWGRERRLFTRPQKLSLVERDGGCARCGLPPHMTKAHHIEWWKRDQGATDLANGILLCESCHHRIHDNGWEIRIDNPPGAGTRRRRGTGFNVKAKVWFIPPAHVDPARTPQLGGRARYDIAA
ncbi:DUF222 domain-containing protein [Microbacterium sp. ARD32]|uniref:HNH endonuclease n=1 Tax=Microbacterium sp. ARD32 TaxID=2962577 RepID=UPI002882CC6F|nr:DUF222 domain-containing protein [Microbacterium sp. ARD32]MDT0158025.1 DUF222 domain-containing protein [Microbacterium sp. ARD32]